MDKKPKPIFILGKHRSGTTGLANQLSEHPEIAAVRHPMHDGVHESAYFSHVAGRYGDLNVMTNYYELIEVLSASDYFSLCEMDTDELLELWPTSYEDLFQKVMEKFARKRNAVFWLEKTPQHTLYSHKLAEYFPDASFVSIVRPLEQVLASNIEYGSKSARERKRKLGRKGFIIKNTLNWVYYNEIIKDLNEKKPNRSLVINFKEFVQKEKKTMRRICEFLGIKFNEKMTNKTFNKNSSFSGEKDREKILFSDEKKMSRILAKVAQSIPLPLLRTVHNFYCLLRMRLPLPNWFFRIQKEEV